MKGDKCFGTIHWCSPTSLYIYWDSNTDKMLFQAGLYQIKTTTFYAGLDVPHFSLAAAHLHAPTLITTLVELMRMTSANKETMAEFMLEPLDALHLELGGCIEFRLNGIQLHAEVFLIHLDRVATFPLNLLFDQHLVVVKEWVKIDNTGVPKGVYIRGSAVHFVTRERW